jgi:hypothetical protein
MWLAVQNRAVNYTSYRPMSRASGPTIAGVRPKDHYVERFGMGAYVHNTQNGRIRLIIRSWLRLAGLGAF